MVLVSIVLIPLRPSRSEMPLSLSIRTNAANISAVACSSSTACDGCRGDNQRNNHRIQLKTVQVGKEKPCNGHMRVSAVGLKGSPCSSAKWLMNPTSKLALWATRTASPPKSKNCGKDYIDFWVYSLHGIIDAGQLLYVKGIEVHPDYKREEKRSIIFPSSPSRRLSR